MTMEIREQPHGAFLYSLDPEIGISDVQASQAILTHGLFSRQVCLTEGHVLDNPAVRRFIWKYVKRLISMVHNLEPGERPLLGLCSRFGSNIDLLVNNYLDTEEDDPFPAYWTSLTPEQNDKIRQQPYPREDYRLARLLKVAGEFGPYLRVLSQYFQRDPQATTVLRPANDTPDETLYRVVNEFMDELYEHVSSVDRDKIIIDRLRNAIAKKPTGEIATRERLLRGLYGSPGVPPVYNGTTIGRRGTAAPDEFTEEWRALIGWIYNFNLATQLNLRPVLNVHWRTVGERWRSQCSIADQLQFHQHGKLPLCKPKYTKHLNFEFVTKVRKSVKFWDGISRLEAARETGQASRVSKALADHMSFLSQQFEDYLEQIGQGHLVGERLIDIVVGMADKTSDLTPKAVRCLTLPMVHWWGLPVALEILKGTFEGGHIAKWLIEITASCAPSGLRNRRIRSDEFIELMAELEDLSGYKPVN